MYEFETFAYLDVEKTASTFIASVFEQFCTESEVRKIKHGGLKKGFDRSKFYFISVRDPLDQYISLYSFGCQGNGQLFERMRNEGLTDLYDGTWPGFGKWLKHILDPSNSFLFERGYQAVADWIGYQSYRAIRLAVPNFSAESKNCYSRKEIKWLYEGLNVVKYVIRYEHLHEDLCFLLANRLSYCMRVPEAVAYIRNTSPINSSQRVDRDMDNPELRAGVRKLLNQREWLLRKVMGYKFPMASGANGKEKPPGPPVSVVPADLSGSATLSPDPVPQEISTKRASLVPVC